MFTFILNFRRTTSESKPPVVGKSLQLPQIDDGKWTCCVTPIGRHNHRPPSKQQCCTLFCECIMLCSVLVNAEIQVSTPAGTCQKNAYWIWVGGKGPDAVVTWITLGCTHFQRQQPSALTLSSTKTYILKIHTHTLTHMHVKHLHFLKGHHQQENIKQIMHIKRIYYNTLKSEKLPKHWGHFKLVFKSTFPQFLRPA